MGTHRRTRRALKGAALAASVVGWLLPVPASAEVPTLPDSSKLPVPGAMRGCSEPASAAVTGEADPRGVAPGSPNPLRGLTFFVDPTEPAWRSWVRYERAGSSDRARLMWKLASRPRFRWFGRWTRPNLRRKVRDYLRCAQAVQPGSVPLITVMRHQGKRCGGGYDGGGRREDRRTRGWYRSFARAIGNARVVIGYEPDSLGTIDCLRGGRRRARLRLLAYGVRALSRLPNATVYLEAGASDWEPATRTARQLRAIGIRRVRGFMLNVTHFDWTSRNIRHGRKISRLTGGKPFVVSTALNGRGPVYRRTATGRRVNVWCHPPRRGLGPPPTTDTGRAKVDAFLWIGRPGYSAGACNGGPLPVGSFWPERALMFATYATDWIGRR